MRCWNQGSLKMLWAAMGSIAEEQWQTHSLWSLTLVGRIMFWGFTSVSSDQDGIVLFLFGVFCQYKKVQIWFHQITKLSASFKVYVRKQIFSTWKITFWYFYTRTIRILTNCHNLTAILFFTLSYTSILGFLLRSKAKMSILLPNFGENIHEKIHVSFK